ncbi:MAG: integrase arm-type DNA-binding domain-containing protein [Campylobacteraceae bacterium]|nr:integrase arm-type DNA-binding domain-containing protein [Campylobacteraceae bacterium]
MPKIAKPLVDTTLRNIKYDPVTKSKNMLSAGKGLVFIINKDNTKWWRFDYVRPNGRRNSISLGKYPLITIAKANALRDEARAKLAQGIDPSIVRKETKQAKQKELEKSENTLNNLIDEYLQVVRGGITEGYFKKMTRRIELDIRPYLGNKPIDEITHFELLACIKRIEDRGAIELAKRTLNYCEAIWRYAVSSGKALNNITANIDKKTVLKKRVKQNFPHITDEKELGVLLNAYTATICQDNFDLSTLYETQNKNC